MSWLMAAIYDRYMRDSERRRFGGWRRELLSELQGDVLEVGAGTGVNLAYYPGTLRSLILAEPDRAMRARLARRLHENAPLPKMAVELTDASVSKLPWQDGRFDSVVSTLVLCSVQDVQQSLAEIRRVLRPQGRFVFLEHVASDEPAHLRLQRTVQPLWGPIAGNCHLARDTESAILQAGFVVERLDRFVEERRFALVRKTVRGVARIA